MDFSLRRVWASVSLLVVTTALATGPDALGAERTPLRDSRAAAARLTDARAAGARSTPGYNGTITGLDSPYAVAVNRYSRKIYVTEPGRNRVVVLDRLGRRKGTFGAAVLKLPTALAFDLSGNLAVLSARAGEIVSFRPNGTLIGRSRIPASLPLGLAFDPVRRHLLVTDTAADAVWITRDGRSWRQQRPAGLTAPVGASAAAGHFFVVSSTDNRLMELSSTGDLIRALPLRRARRPLGVTIPPFGNGLVVSSADGRGALFSPHIGSPLERFGDGGRMTTPSLPGSECTRVLFPDSTGNRVVAFDLPNAENCTQGLGLRGAVTGRGLRRIVAPVVAENDSVVSLKTRISVPSRRGGAKRWRLRSLRTSLAAGIEKKLRLKVPASAAAAIRNALTQRRRSTATLIYTVTNRAGDRRRVVGRVLYSP